MPDNNNMIIMLGLGAAALWFMNRGGSQEDQVDQLAGAAMMTASTVWDQQALIATSYDMPLIGIETMDTGFWGPVQSNVDISNLSSKESFRAVNLDSGHAFTTTGEVLGEYVRGFTGSQPAPPTNAVVVSQTATPAWAGGNNWWDEG